MIPASYATTPPDPDALAAAGEVFAEGANTGDVVLMIAGAVAALALITASLLGKKVPLLAPLLSALLGLAKKVRRKEPKPPGGVDAVVNVVPVGEKPPEA